MGNPKQGPGANPSTTDKCPVLAVLHNESRWNYRAPTEEGGRSWGGGPDGVEGPDGESTERSSGPLGNGGGYTSPISRPPQVELSLFRPGRRVESLRIRPCTPVSTEGTGKLPVYSLLRPPRYFTLSFPYLTPQSVFDPSVDRRRRERDRFPTNSSWTVHGRTPSHLPCLCRERETCKYHCALLSFSCSSGEVSPPYDVRPSRLPWRDSTTYPSRLPWQKQSYRPLRGLLLGDSNTEPLLSATCTPRSPLERTVSVTGRRRAPSTPPDVSHHYPRPLTTLCQPPHPVTTLCQPLHPRTPSVGRSTLPQTQNNTHVTFGLLPYGRIFKETCHQRFPNPQPS